MKYEKPELTIEQKIALLRKRGLIIDDEENATKYLQHIGYFRLSWYFKFFQDRKTDLFEEWTTFEQVIDLYIFDRKLRLLTLDAIEKIEVSLKSIICDWMCVKYWKFWYLEDENFSLETDINKQIHEKLQIKLNAKITKSSAPYVRAYTEKYTDEKYLPSRMLFEELTLWELSNIYEILNRKDAQKIADEYRIYFVDLRKWIKWLVSIRNICAHNARLWNRSFIIRPRVEDSVLAGKFILEKNGNKIEVAPNFYNNVQIINYLLKRISKNPSRLWKLERLLSEYPKVTIESMGFNENRKQNFK